MYGSRGKIGLIVPSLNNAMEFELTKMAPDGVIVLATRLFLEKGLPNNIGAMSERIDDAVDLLMTADVDCILFGCTSGSFVHQLGWDEAFIQRTKSRTGIPVTTTLHSITRALEVMDITSLSVATPYVDELNQSERRFFEDIGIQVKRIKGLGCTSGSHLHRVPSSAAMELALSVDVGAAEGILISCTDFASIGIVEQLELLVDKPVITSNTASLWQSLRLLEVNEPVTGYGKLLTIL